MGKVGKHGKKKHHSKSTTAPTPITINVIVECDDPLRFYLASSSPGVSITPVVLGGNTTQMITFDNSNGGAPNGFMITFTLVDLTRKGYQYYFDPSDPDPKTAIWAKKITDENYCPTKKQLTGPLQPQTVDANSLVVKNPNGKLEYFGFAFIVAIPGSTKTLRLDPVGNNMNGSGQSWN